MSEVISLQPQPLPAARYQAHRMDIDAAVAAVFRSGQFVLADQAASFEREFAAFLGATHCVGVASGTDALELALRACGIGPGDGVLTVAHTAVATVAAIERSGATPVLVDIDPDTFTMSPMSLQATLAEYHTTGGRRPVLKAVIPVHLYGLAADMPAILEIARRHGLRVIEDCAQSHGATIQGRTTGTWGDLGAFSFYPTKNLGGFGDGGAVVTSNEALATQVRLLREYGWHERYISAIPGCNSRLDELQAAILRALLPHLAAENAQRREVASRYHAELGSGGLIAPLSQAETTHAFHQYVVRSAERDRLKAFLTSEGVLTQIHYPMPIHLQPAYRARLVVPEGGLPQTEAAAREVLSLPMSPHLTTRQVNHVCASLRRWREGKRGAA